MQYHFAAATCNDDTTLSQLLIFLVVAGILYAVYRDARRQQSTVRTIVNTIAGLILAALAWFILTVLLLPWFC